MFRRGFWFVVGAAAGGWATARLQRVQRKINRYKPGPVSAEVVDRARDLSRTVRDAVAEGRQAMRETESELRADRR